MQLNLFDYVVSCYARNEGAITNEALYDAVAGSAGIAPSDLHRTTPVGKNGTRTSRIKREIRWHQQTLKQAGLLRRTKQRGNWTLTQEGRAKYPLRRAEPNATMVAYSTDLGVALWSLAKDTFSALNGDEPITLCLTSPPYPLKSPRSYGNPSESEYVEFLIENLRPIVENLKPGGSVCLNVSNDIFVSQTPARSLYAERLILAIHDELGLHLMDRLIWHNPSKSPGPTQWACKTRQQLKTAWEPIYWFSNEPRLAVSDNRRVLQPHNDRMKRLIAAGGESNHRESSDKAYTVRPGSFGGQTDGTIPTNILRFSHTCRSQLEYKKQARAAGLVPHGAPYPLSLARFLIEFLSGKDDLVVDPFGGSMTTAVAAEELGRRWISTDCMYEYVRGSKSRFVDAEWNTEFLEIAG